MKRYYVDTCIYLNLWQKEVVRGLEVWRFAQEFFERTRELNALIFYSGFLLKELSYILTPEEFERKRDIFISSSRFQKITLTREEYSEAQLIEKELKHTISFFDIIHMLLARKTHSILVTRDGKLISVCKNHGVVASTPEHL